MQPNHQTIAAAIERYVEAHQFDPHGIMYSAVDWQSGRPIARELLLPQTVPRRAEFDPWSYWAYEDSIQNTGIYLDGLIRKFEVTGDATCLDRARKLWSVVRKVYSCSQVFGIGSFLRPYGGFERMGQFAEPLGTDQASPLFSGLYRFMKHANDAERDEIADLLLQSLTWYEAQGFRYFYYKFMIHEWEPTYQHAASYYLPGIAWAARVTGEAKWKKHLKERLGLFERGPIQLDESYQKINLYRSLYWGSDLPVLAENMGDEFARHFTSEMIETSYRLCLEDLAHTYNEPGMIERVCPESAKPGFQPYVRDDYDRNVGMGFAYFSCVHGGRRRPRMEQHFLCGLAALGHEGSRNKAIELLGLRMRVAEDFTDFLAEDFPKLPVEVNLYARSVGHILIEWWRDYWLLRQAAEQKRSAA